MKPTHSARMFSQLAACLDPDKLYAVSMLVALAERHHLPPINPTGQDQTRTARKNESLDLFVVDMEVFAVYIQNLWDPEEHP